MLIKECVSDILSSVFTIINFSDGEKKWTQKWRMKEECIVRRKKMSHNKDIQDFMNIFIKIWYKCDLYCCLQLSSCQKWEYKVKCSGHKVCL